MLNISEAEIPGKVPSNQPERVNWYELDLLHYTLPQSLNIVFKGKEKWSTFFHFH